MARHDRVRQGGETASSTWSPSGPDGEIVFTQHDVRALQLAKAAIAAGWSLLLEERAASTPDDLDQVYVAGAFGNYLDVEQLARHRPASRRSAPERISFVGNAAGVGAQMALIDVRARERMARLRARIRFLELATNTEFLEVFSARLRF